MAHNAMLNVLQIKFLFEMSSFYNQINLTHQIHWHDSEPPGPEDLLQHAMLFYGIVVCDRFSADFPTLASSFVSRVYWPSLAWHVRNPQLRSHCFCRTNEINFIGRTQSSTNVLNYFNMYWNVNWIESAIFSLVALRNKYLLLVSQHIDQ